MIGAYVNPCLNQSTVYEGWLRNQIHLKRHENAAIKRSGLTRKWYVY
jgi:hypothetical protein